MSPMPLESCNPDDARVALIARESTADKLENAMAKGQMRSNKEKKKPKQDKNVKKGGVQPGKK
jgi:hypothetical protein